THVLEERAPARATVRVVASERDLCVALRRELAVDRDDQRSVADDRVDARAVAVRELDLVCARRQAVLQKPLEHELAEATTRLRRAKQVLQRADVLRKITDTHALLSERAKLSREIRERPLRRRRLRDKRLLRRAERALHLAAQLAHELRVRDACVLDAATQDLERGTDVRASDRGRHLRTSLQRDRHPRKCDRDREARQDGNQIHRNIRSSLPSELPFGYNPADERHATTAPLLR